MARGKGKSIRYITDEDRRKIAFAAIELLAACGGTIESSSGLATRMLYENVRWPAGVERVSLAQFRYFVAMLEAEMKAVKVRRKATSSYKYELTQVGWAIAEQQGFQKGNYNPGPPKSYYHGSRKECPFCGRKVGPPNFVQHVAAHMRNDDPWPEGFEPTEKMKKHATKPRSKEAEKALKRRQRAQKAAGAHWGAKKQEKAPEAAEGALELPTDEAGMVALAVNVFNLFLKKLAEPAVGGAGLEVALRENATLSDRVTTLQGLLRDEETQRQAAEKDLYRVRNKLEAADKNIERLMARINEQAAEIEKLVAENKKQSIRPGTALGNLLSDETRKQLGDLLSS